MKHFCISVGKKQFIVEAEVIICGKDLNICIGGGEAYHIGASALAIPRKSLEDEEANSSSASVLCVIGHKEDELARQAALELSSLFQCKVNVTLGMHIDHATKEDIQILYENYKIVLHEIKQEMGGLHFLP